jgi:serine/threonine protein kinase
LLTGKLPFSGENEMALIHSIFNSEPLSPAQLRSGEINPRWDEIVTRCLAKNPQNRFNSIEKVISAISDLEMQKTD